MGSPEGQQLLFPDLSPERQRAALQEEYEQKLSQLHGIKTAEEHRTRAVREGSAKDWQAGEKLEKMEPQDRTSTELSREELIKRIKELREQLRDKRK